MKFQWARKQVILKGLTYQEIEGEDMEKEVGKHPIEALVQIVALDSNIQAAKEEEVAIELQ